MYRNKILLVTLMVCVLPIALGMPSYAMSSNDSIHGFAGLPFGMPRDELDDWLEANMSAGYVFLEGWKTDDYERIDIEGDFLYDGKSCNYLTVEMDSAQRLTNLDFYVLDASYHVSERFDVDQLMLAYDGYFALVEELTAAYGTPDGSLLRYGDMYGAAEDRLYPENAEELKALAKGDTPYMTVLRFGNVLLTCYKPGRGAAYAYSDVALSTSLFFFGPSKLEFARALFPLYPSNEGI